MDTKSSNNAEKRMLLSLDKIQDSFDTAGIFNRVFEETKAEDITVLAPKFKKTRDQIIKDYLHKYYGLTKLSQVPDDKQITLKESGIREGFETEKATAVTTAKSKKTGGIAVKSYRGLYKLGRVPGLKHTKVDDPKVTEELERKKTLVVLKKMHDMRSRLDKTQNGNSMSNIIHCIVTACCWYIPTWFILLFMRVAYAEFIEDFEHYGLGFPARILYNVFTFIVTAVQYIKLFLDLRPIQFSFSFVWKLCNAYRAFKTPNMIQLLRAKVDHTQLLIITQHLMREIADRDKSKSEDPYEYEDITPLEEQIESLEETVKVHRRMKEHRDSYVQEIEDELTTLRASLTSLTDQQRQHAEKETLLALEIEANKKYSERIDSQIANQVAKLTQQHKDLKTRADDLDKQQDDLAVKDLELKRREEVVNARHTCVSYIDMLIDQLTASGVPLPGELPDERTWMLGMATKTMRRRPPLATDGWNVWPDGQTEMHRTTNSSTRQAKPTRETTLQREAATLAKQAREMGATGSKRWETAESRVDLEKRMAEVCEKIAKDNPRGLKTQMGEAVERSEMGKLTRRTGMSGGMEFGRRRMG